MFVLNIVLVLFTTLTLVKVGISTSNDDITSEVFGNDSVDMFPIAVGDYDADRTMDTIFLSRNLSSIQIYFGHTAPPFLRPRSGFACNFRSADDGSPAEIVGLVLADFTGDGILDILVTIDGDKYKTVSVFRGNPKLLDCSSRSALQLEGNKTVLQLKQEPVVVDVNGDMIADLAGQPYGEDSVRKLWLFSGENPVKVVDIPCGLMSCLPLAVPHSTSFADMDGDFSPELIIVSKNTSADPSSHQLEVFSISDVQDNEPRLERYMNVPIESKEVKPNIIGSLLFLDMEQDGKIIPVIPYCTDPSCHSSGIMIRDGEEFKALDVNFTDNSGRKWGYLLNESKPYDQTITLRQGDVDLDGYPDLIGTLGAIGGNNINNISTQSVIFSNVPCKDCKYARTFELKFDLLSKYDNSVSAIFYDFYDNGLLDVMLVRKNYPGGSNGTVTGHKVQVVLNSPKYDGYFLKLMMTSEHCSSQNCPPYGAVLPGASMNYTMTNREGFPQVSKAVQFFRSAHFPVDLPYVIIGTGSTPNFIDTVWVGKSPSKHVISVRKWRQIIPNSHLVVIPYSKSWELRYFLSTNKEGALSTLKALLLILFINGIIVFVLWLKERKEDRRNVQLRGTLNFVRLT